MYGNLSGALGNNTWCVVWQKHDVDLAEDSLQEHEGANLLEIPILQVEH